MDIKNKIKNLWLEKKADIKGFHLLFRQLDENDRDEALKEIWDETDDKLDDSILYEHLYQVQDRLWNSEKKEFKLVNTLLKIAAVICFPILGALSAMYIYDRMNGDGSVSMVECYAENGNEKEIVLPDGSTVTLHPGSLMIYPEDFKSGERSIYLSGSGNFDVYKDPEHKFVVNTANLSVTALGTYFNVDAYPDSRYTVTTLAEGSVRVNSKYGENINVILKPNEQIIYDNVNNLYTKENVDSKKYMQYNRERLIFEGVPFDEIVTSLEDRFNVVVSYDNSLFDKNVVTVRFKSGSTLKESLDILKLIVSEMDYTIKDNIVYIIKQK